MRRHFIHFAGIQKSLIGQNAADDARLRPGRLPRILPGDPKGGTVHKLSLMHGGQVTLVDKFSVCFSRPDSTDT